MRKYLQLISINAFLLHRATGRCDSNEVCASCSDATWRRDGDATAMRRRCDGDATAQKPHINRCLKATDKYCQMPAHTPVGMCRYNWNKHMQTVIDTDVPYVGIESKIVGM